MKRWSREIVFAIVALALALLLAGFFIVANWSEHLPTRTIDVAGHEVHALVAQTKEQREKGLGGKDGLAPDEGMLFVFPEAGTYAFWMKDMKFAIDIVWIAADHTTIYIKESVRPETYPAAYAPDTPVTYVLELPAGYSKENGLKIGDTVRF